MSTALVLVSPPIEFIKIYFYKFAIYFYIKVTLVFYHHTTLLPVKERKASREREERTTKREIRSSYDKGWAIDRVGEDWDG